MSTPVTIAQFSNLIDPAIQKYFFEEYDKVEPKLEQIFKVEDQEVYNHEEMTMAGLGRLSSITEGQTFPEDAPMEQYKTTYTPVKYGGLIQVSYETKLFERMDLVAQVPKEAAKAAATEVEEIGANVWRRAFNTSYTSYGDGLPLCSTAHTRIDGGSNQSNASSSGIPFSEANLEVAMILMEEILNDRGNPIGVFADTLMVPLALRKEAIIVTKSDLRSGTADNDLNVYNGSISKTLGGTIPNIIVWKRLGNYVGGSDSAWFLLDQAQHKVKFKWADRTKVEKDDSVGFKNDLMTWKVRFMAGTGWSDWRGVWGSKGDGATYSS